MFLGVQMLTVEATHASARIQALLSHPIPVTLKKQLSGCF